MCFGSSEVKILLESEDEKQEINTTIANDGKYLNEYNRKVLSDKQSVKVVLKGEEIRIKYWNFILLKIVLNEINNVKNCPFTLSGV